jgi:response regulator RpfG family c-di-GMP phosphodiesterase
MDERNTVVWTDEMAQAWSVAQPIVQVRDMVGARMAFISAYERLVRTAREERRVPVVSVSLGWDAELRAKAVEQAVSLGYLPQGQATEYLPPPAPVINPLELLRGKPVDAPLEIRERIEKLKQSIFEANERAALESERRKQAEIKDLRARQERAQRAADEVLQARSA